MSGKFWRISSKQATVLCAENAITISMLHPIILSIIDNHLANENNDDTLAVEIKTALTNSLNWRFGMTRNTLDDVTVHQISSFLDPHYKNLSHEKTYSERMFWLELEIESFIKNKMSAMACNTLIEPAEKINNPEETALDFLFKVQAQ